MNFNSKIHAGLGIAAVVALMADMLPVPALAQLGGPPHAPYLTRAMPQKAQAVRPASGSIAADRPASATQSDVAAEPFPVVTSGRARTRATVFGGKYHGGPPR